jgi:hypothetical protein
MTQPSGRAPVCANCGHEHVGKCRHRVDPHFYEHREDAPRCGCTASAPPRTEAPETTTWTVCQITGRRAQEGACPVHHGDACLVVMNFSVREKLPSPSADTGGAAETQRVLDFLDIVGYGSQGWEAVRAIVVAHGARLAESERNANQAADNFDMMAAKWGEARDESARYWSALTKIADERTSDPEYYGEEYSTTIARLQKIARAALTPPEPT